MSLDGVLSVPKVQEDSLFSREAKRSFRWACFREFSDSWMLRYFVGKELRWNPNSMAMFSCILRGVLKKKIWELLWLIEVSEATTKSSKIDFRVLASRRVGSPIRVVSSKNWVWERGGFILWIDRPLWEVLLTTECMDLLIPSTIKMNRNGERGSPCLMPLDGLKVEDGIPLRKIKKKEEDMREVIHWIQVGLKQKPLRFSLMYCQLILSKDFDMFHFMSILGVLLSFRVWTNSWVRIMLSRIWCHST